MGTRCLVYIIDRQKTILTIYRQFDGYLTGMGKDIKERFQNHKIVTHRYQSRMTDKNYANGMGCFAAQLVAYLKEEIGNVYIYPPNVSNCYVSYTYTIMEIDEKLFMKVEDYEKKTIYLGFLDDFDPIKVEDSMYK